MTEHNDDPFSQPVEIPIDGTLDLHTFRPQEVHDLIPDYLALCYEEGISEVTIIHGKGTGALRETVHALLKRHPLVREFHLDRDTGNWGVTRVTLRRRTP